MEVGEAVERRRHDQLWRLVAERVERRTFSGWAGVVCDLVVQEVAVDAAAISIRTVSRSQELVAASDSWARVLEELQYMLGEGPGAAAFADGGPVLVSDLESAENRWPGFVDAAAEVELGAVFAFPVQNGAIRLGTLDLYRRRPGALSEEGLADVAVLADLATTALLTDVGSAQVAAAPWARPEAPGHYFDVNVATGMLAAELGISLDEAFTRIRAHAFSNNISLLDVAREVLARRLRSDAFHE